MIGEFLQNSWLAMLLTAARMLKEQEGMVKGTV